MVPRPGTPRLALQWHDILQKHENWPGSVRPSSAETHLRGRLSHERNRPHHHRLVPHQVGVVGVRIFDERLNVRAPKCASAELRSCQIAALLVDEPDVRTPQLGLDVDVRKLVAEGRVLQQQAI